MKTVSHSYQMYLVRLQSNIKMWIHANINQYSILIIGFNLNTKKQIEMEHETLLGRLSQENYFDFKSNKELGGSDTHL